MKLLATFFATMLLAVCLPTTIHAADGTPVWTNRYNGPGNATAYAVAVDDSSNVFVTGSSSDSNSANGDYATIKYSGAGVALWTNHYNGPGNSDDQASAMAVDGSGNVFVTGRSVGSGSSKDYATIKYSGTGVALWTNRYNGPGNSDDQASATAVDGSGNVFVTGDSVGANGYSDYATIKYSGAGVPLWTNRYNGPGNSDDQASAMAVDGSGNVFVTGDSVGTNGYSDYATIKYSGAGVPLWTNRYNGPGNYADSAYGAAVDSSDNVFVTGGSSGTIDYSDYATIKYSSAGMALWTNRYNGPESGVDYPYAVAVDDSGNVFVTGQSFNGTSYDYATIKYSGPTSLIFVITNGNFGFTNQQFRLTLTGPIGSNAMISASTNLQTWIPLVTNPLTGGSLNFTDTVATNFINRFYRANLQ